ncbi:MAG: M20/M25/M40 family metallo-hydrolase [Proteobacteria bacterium]|nr:M20/M25/M40 family metallo-hydrolase [Pseudomonadota bacterium]
MNMNRVLVTFIGLLFTACVLAAEPPTLPSDANELVYAIYKDLIEINTTHSAGDNTLAANRVADWLRAAGFAEGDIFVGGKAEKKGNLVARLRGSGDKPPFILLAHLDVVEAQRSDWSMDPFTLNEQDGYFYGRGTVPGGHQHSQPDPLEA